MNRSTKLTWIVTRASLVAGVIYFALIILCSKLFYRIHSGPWLSTVVAIGTVVGPFTAAAIWIFRALKRDYSRREALKAAASYAIFAPFAVAVGNLLAVFPGGYAALALGPLFGFVGSVAGFLSVVVALSVLICRLAVRFAREADNTTAGDGQVLP